MSERENLVQYNNLVPTEKVVNPEDIPANMLFEMWSKAKQICADQNFCAIAFNQISRETLDRLGFGGVNPSIIYFANYTIMNGRFSDQLLINPEISIEKILGKSIEPEGCGSVRDADGILPNMFIERYSVVRGAGYLWKPSQNKPGYREFIAAPFSGGIVQHEVNHLFGRTALSQPETMIDFTDRKSRNEIIKNSFLKDADTFDRFLKRFPHWLIYNNKENSFDIISPNGNFIMKDFE